MIYFRTMLLLITFLLPTLSHADIVESFEQQLAQHKGKVVYLDFWASWCQPCKQSFPWLNAMQRKYDAQNFTVFSVNLDANPQFAAQFLAEVPADFPIFYDAKGKLSKKFKLRGMPSSFLIDPNGKIVKAHTGFNAQKKAQYENDIKELLTSFVKLSQNKNIQ